jgi:eukaryotic-like serine/threonine-protein kinase
VTLDAGRKLGPYEIVALAGAGGMGEVYKARDVRLQRTVALKILPAGTPTARARFEREARAIAALSHPNICSIYDLGNDDGTDYLVMEYLEGETLAERIARGPLPISLALRYGTEIADSLHQAHRAGIAHRDLKPGNIMITAGGVRLLDFGLARIIASPAPSGEAETATEIAPLTAVGTTVGTVHYMAPEQLEGKDLDHRADIFALGVVLYEMVTGRRPFGGDSRSSLSDAILHSDPPPLRTLRPAAPLALERTIATSLEKNRESRWQSAHDVAMHLRWIAESSSAGTAVDDIAWRSRRRWWWGVAGLLAVSLTVLIAAAAWKWLSKDARPEPVAVRMSSALPSGVAVTAGPGYSSSLALSPDGRILIVAGTGGDDLHLYQRPLDQLEMMRMEGTQGGTGPFFSPDGKWIGFFAGGRLRRIPAEGGTAVDVAAVPAPTFGASWAPDDRIVFVAGPGSPLRIVDVRNGTIEMMTRLADGETAHSNPEVSPDGRIVVFDDGRWIHAVDRASGRRAKLVEGVAPRHATAGYLVFCRGTSLLGAAFNADRLEITSPAIPLIDGISDSSSTSRHYAVSRTGTLAYVPMVESHSLVLVRSDGTEQLIDEKRPNFENPQFSPDGKRIAVASRRRRDENTEVWLYDLDTGAPSRLTFDGGRAPVWTPDGSAVTYSHLGQERGIHRKSTDGAPDAERIVGLTPFHWLIGWTPDGGTLAYGAMVAQSDRKSSDSAIWAFSEGRSRYVVEPGNVWGGRLSPDGRWLAYYVLEAGNFEVFVTPFPGGGTHWQVSDGGGRDPGWGPDGTELYYRSGDRLVAAQIDTVSRRVLSRRLVLEPFRPPHYDDYDIHPDGKTLVIVRPAGGPPSQAILVLNWDEEVRRAISKR